AWRLWSPRRSPPADDDLARLLDGLPHVASVEGDVTGRPERVVVHLRDRHLLPRDAFDKDVKAAAGRELNGAELERLYAEHLDAVEAVQTQLDADNVAQCLAEVSARIQEQDPNLELRRGVQELPLPGASRRGDPTLSAPSSVDDSLASRTWSGRLRLAVGS